MIPLHAGNPAAQLVVGMAQAFGDQLSRHLCLPTVFFGSSTLAVLMGMPTEEALCVLEAFRVSGMTCRTFENAEEELHRLILCRWKFLTTSAGHMQKGFLWSPSRNERLKAIREAKVLYENVWSLREEEKVS